MERPKKNPEQRKKKVSITLDAKLVEELKDLAKREGKSLLELIE